MNGRSEFIPESKLLSSYEDEESLFTDKSPIAYTFDPEAILLEAEIAIDDLTDLSEQNELVLPDRIDWLNFGDQIGLIYQTISLGNASEVVELLPAKIKITDYDFNFERLLENLIKAGFAEQIISKLVKIDSCADLVDPNKGFITSFFRMLIRLGYVDQLVVILPEIYGDITLNKWIVEIYADCANLRETYRVKLVEEISNLIPQEISLEDAFPWDLANLSLLARIDIQFVENFLGRFKKEVNILVLNEKQLDFLNDLVGLGFSNQVVKLIKPSCNRKISREACYLLHRLAKNGQENIALEFVKIALDKSDSTTVSVCSSLVEKGFADEVIALGILPDNFLMGSPDLNKYISLFMALVKVGKGSEIIKRITRINLNSLEPLEYEFIDRLIKFNFSGDLARLISDYIDYSHLTSKARRFLAKLAPVSPKIKEGLLSNIPEKFDLSMINELILYLDGLLDGPLADEILSRFTGLNQLTDFKYDFYGQDSDRNQLYFLTEIAISGHVDQLNALFAEIFKKIESGLRQPIDHESLSLTRKAGPHLHELIKKFPIIDGYGESLRFGWIKRKVNKGGSENFVYLNLGAGNLKVIFRSSLIQQSYLASYQKAFNLIPDYVVGANYPELQNNKSEKKCLSVDSLGSYREVYAGPSLDLLDLDALPVTVRDSIENQRKYILLKLGINGINHGHAHERNFNVRFLLTKGQQKKLFFDVNMAIRFAIEQQMALTPIVTLRDWDAATSS